MSQHMVSLGRRLQRASPALTNAVQPFACCPCELLLETAPACCRRRKFPIYISQDGKHGPVHQVASELARKHRSFVGHLVHKQAPRVRENRDRLVACIHILCDGDENPRCNKILSSAQLMIGLSGHQSCCGHAVGQDTCFTHSVTTASSVSNYRPCHLPKRITEPLSASCRWNLPVYRHITAHYMWAFDQLFGCAGYRRVVVLEDDMLVAPDLFAYFEATGELLDQVGASVHYSHCCVYQTISKSE